MSFASPSTPDQRVVSFLTEDSVHLRGTYWEPRDDKSVSLLLLHDAGSNRAAWAPYVPLFRTRGWSVLSFDLRGHGESVRQDMRADLLKPLADDLYSPHAYPQDVRAAIAFLRRQEKADPAKVAIIGVGLGSDLAYAAAGRAWGNTSTVCIGLDDERGRALAGSGTFAPRSIYLLYGENDTKSAAAVTPFTANAQQPAEVKVYENTASSGMALFAEQQPEILARSIMWIERTMH